MSSVGGATTDVHWSVDSNQNCNIKSKESAEVVVQNDRVAALQFEHSAVPTRRSSFVITDILRTGEELDDADSTSLLTDEPASPEVAKSPHRTRSLDDGLSWTSPPVISGLSLTDSHSRFRIVKIESRDRHRGRWTCHDFADPPEHTKTEQTVKNDSGTSNTNRNSPSIYYIPGVQDALKSPFGIVYNTGGHPVLEANLLGPSSPRYARGSPFFSCGLSTLDDVSEDMLQSEINFSPQSISSVDQPEPVGHSAARQLFAGKEKNIFAPLSVSVSQPVPSDTDDTNVNGSCVPRPLSSSLLMAADAAAGQASPLDAMMTATLGTSSSEPDMRLVIVSFTVC